MKKLLQNIGIKVSLITILINFLLFLLKLIIGFISHSHAIISDAFHSLSDVITTIAVIFGLVLASKEADESHPYGHEKIESLVAIILSMVLLISGLSIGYLGLKDIFMNKAIIVPGFSALVAALISVAVKEGMFHYTMHVAKKINSSSMKADAWHHRSDAISSIGSFIGVLLARIGFPIFDPICSILICVLIIKCALEIFGSATKEVVDASCDEDLNKQIIDTIYKTEQDIKINDFKSRMFGNKCYIDVEIALDGNLSLNKANDIVTKIHNKVENNFNMVKHCNIHIVPNSH